MISFSLKCENNHQFEGWFRSSVDYEDQVKKGFISCPNCNNKKISKALMSPAVRSSKKLDKKTVNQKTNDNLRGSEKRVRNLIAITSLTEGEDLKKESESGSPSFL